jgi:hypothetical protein
MVDTCSFLYRGADNVRLEAYFLDHQQRATVDEDAEAAHAKDETVDGLRDHPRLLGKSVDSPRGNGRRGVICEVLLGRPVVGVEDGWTNEAIVRHRTAREFLIA